MKTKTITLYEYSELKPEAKKKALAHYREHYFDDYALRVHLDNLLQELLEKNGIIPVSTADRKYASKYGKLYYSLANCQGDGVMFEGVFSWKKYEVRIQQSGHYYHSNSKTVEITFGDDIANEASEKVYAEFEAIYQKICKELERSGYDETDYLQSEEHFIGDCEANEWTFREDGTREEL